MGILIAIIVFIASVLVIAFVIRAMMEAMDAETRAEEKRSQRKKKAENDLKKSRLRIAQEKEERAKKEYAVLPNPMITIPTREKFTDVVLDSESIEGVFYRVSLAQMTCTCPNFKKERTEFAELDPRRACKHLIEVLDDAGLLEEQVALTKAWLTSRSSHKSMVNFQIEDGTCAALAYSRQEKWADVYARMRRKGELVGNCSGEYQCFGFNIESGGWAYGDSPVGARNIKNVIKQILAQGSNGTI